MGWGSGESDFFINEMLCIDHIFVTHAQLNQLVFILFP
jgi:hypothetical protein